MLLEIEIIRGIRVTTLTCSIKLEIPNVFIIEIKPRQRVVTNIVIISILQDEYHFEEFDVASRTKKIIDVCCGDVW